MMRRPAAMVGMLLPWVPHLARVAATPGRALAGRRSAHPLARIRWRPAALLLPLLLAACEQPQMADQPRYDPYESAPGWPQDQSARRPVEGTVARGDAVGPAPDRFPLELDRALLEHGRERFEIFCTPCHGRGGYGDGMIVQRGFPAPPSLHEARLRQAELRHYYDVMTDGFGAMYSYADRVPPDDRWAIAAYIRALQLSQHADVADLTPEQRQRLEEQP